MRNTTMTAALLAATTIVACAHRRTEPEVSVAPRTTTTSAFLRPDTTVTYSSSGSYVTGSTPMQMPAAAPRGQANGDVRADMRAERRDVRMGITSLERARRELEHAGNDFGGHRADALKAVDAALKELRLADTNQGRDAAVGSETTQGMRTERRELHLALADLERARGDMEHATHNFNGRRKEALSAVDTAIREIRTAADTEK